MKTTSFDSSKIYIGWHEDPNPAKCSPVHVEVSCRFKNGKEMAKYDLKHEVYHSPDGFEWGYSGSGPADLARSILADHFGKVPKPHIYLRFKDDFVSKFPYDIWTITSTKIEKWWQAYKKELSDLWGQV